MLWPLFARAPRHWFLENFLLSVPGVQSVFFCCAPLGAATFQRGQSKKKKKTPPRAFFFLAPVPGKGRGRRSPVGRRHGARAKKKHTTQDPGCSFFCCGPARTLTHSLRAWVAMPPPRRGGVFFFAVAPPGRSLTHCGLGRFRQGPGGVFFFVLRPRRVFLDNNKKCLEHRV